MLRWGFAHLAMRMLVGSGTDVGRSSLYSRYSRSMCSYSQAFVYILQDVLNYTNFMVTFILYIFTNPLKIWSKVPLLYFVMVHHVGF